MCNIIKRDVYLEISCDENPNMKGKILKQPMGKKLYSLKKQY